MRDGFIKVGAASPELRVGQPFFNISKMLELFSLASGYGVKVLVYPELSITGYTCQDLFLQDALIQDSRKALLEFVSATKGSDILSFVGFPLEHNGKLYNTAAAVQDGRILSYTAKRNLPCYGEFQEDRWFTQSPDDVEYIEGGIPFGFKIIHRYGLLSVSAEICEDLWVSSPPSVSHAKNGANIIVNLSASDEVIGKEEYRRNLVSMQSAKLICGYVYADASEGESTTDMVFTGADIIAENGSILNQSSFSTGALTISEIDVSKLNEESNEYDLVETTSLTYSFDYSSEFNFFDTNENTLLYQLASQCGGSIYPENNIHFDINDNQLTEASYVSTMVWILLAAVIVYLVDITIRKSIFKKKVKIESKEPPADNFFN